MAEPLTGSCACGAIRYLLTSEPRDAGWCHCTTCRRNSGAPAMVFASVSEADYVLTQGADRVGVYKSSDVAHRTFCSACGSPLTMRYDARPGIVDFTVTSLDDPERVAPEFHIFCRSRIHWFDPADGLPRYERFRTGAE